VVAFSVEHIRQDIAGHLSGQRGNSHAPQAWAGRRPSPPPTPPSGGGATEQAERHLLRALVSDDPALLGCALRSVSAADFVSDRARVLAAALFAHFERLGTLDAQEVLAALGDGPSANLLASLLMNSTEPLSEDLVAGSAARLKANAKSGLYARLKLQVNAGTANASEIEQLRRLQSELKGTPKSPAPLEG